MYSSSPRSPKSPREHVTESDLELDENSPLQLIYDCVNSVEGIDDTNPVFQSILYHMRNVRLECLGFDQSYLESLTTAQCVSIIENPKFEIAAFLLPKGFIIHLHDHPHMFVCSSILAGSIKIRSFSRLSQRSPLSPMSSKQFKAKLELDLTKTDQDKAWYLTPQMGNYHEIAALTNCVILDVLSPPYEDVSRPCTFYTASRDTKPSQWILKAMPLNLQCQILCPLPVAYRGYVPCAVETPVTSSEETSVKESFPLLNPTAAAEKCDADNSLVELKKLLSI